jgi:2-amino-4-hydroxy-6-hydroxymethyldihydropteridine diphosphokinase
VTAEPPRPVPPADPPADPPRVTAYVGLGSNLGDRHERIEAALAAMRALPDTTVAVQSSLYETEPVGVVDQPWFLNGAARLETALAPERLLWNLRRIESALGRVRTRAKGPRTIDLDLLLYGDRVIDTPDLTVPHPELERRAFVLVPLVELDPLLVHPRTGETLLAHLGRLEGGPAVHRGDAGHSAR